MFTLTLEQFETIRDRFFETTNLDIHCLDAREIRDLLELLPLAIIALHHENDLTIVYRDGDQYDEDDGPDPADMPPYA